MEPDPHPSHADILQGLVAMGNDIARAIHAEVRNRDTTEPEDRELTLEQAAIAFDRVARAVRRSVTLLRHLHDAPERADDAGLRHQVDVRKRVIRTVEDTLTRKQPPNADALHAELRHRLDSPELEHEIAGRPTEEIIHDILRDLGLNGLDGPGAFFRRRTPADLQALEELAHAVPSRTRGRLAPRPAPFPAAATAPAALPAPPPFPDSA